LYPHNHHLVYPKKAYFKQVLYIWKSIKYIMCHWHEGRIFLIKNHCWPTKIKFCYFVVQKYWFYWVT
jgi:hypothetical protein